MLTFFKKDFSLAKYSWIVVIIFWLILYSFRPFILGFYHDDWYVLILPIRDSTAFSSGRFHYFISLYANRPLAGCFSYILSSLCGESTFFWHTAVIFINLGTAFFIRLLIRKFLHLINSNSLIIGDILAIFWLAFPWTMGFTVWPTIVPCQLAIICFSCSGIFLFQSWQNEKISLFIPALFFLLSCLTYESFYGQFIILIGIGLIYGIHKKVGLKAILYPLISYLIAQFLAVSWNRISAMILQSSAINKSFYSDWYLLWFQSVLTLPNTLLYSISFLKKSLIYLIAIALMIVLFSLVIGFKKTNIIRFQIKLLLTLLAFIVGGLLAISVYSLAGPGYGMASIGLASRVTLSLSFWIVMMLIPMYLILWASSKPLKITTLIITLGIIISLSGSTIIQIEAWAKSWEIQKNILVSVPIDKLSKINQGSYFILTKSPTEYQGVSTFSAPWDFDPAMKYTYPNLKLAKFLVDTDTVITSWNGKVIEHGVLPYWSVTYQATEVWIWNYETGTLEQAIPPIKL